MVALDVLIIIECRAPDQSHSLILCYTDKELDNLLGFQFKLAGQIYGMEKNVTYRATICMFTRSQPVFQTETTNKKDMSTWIYLSN